MSRAVHGTEVRPETHRIVFRILRKASPNVSGCRKQSPDYTLGIMTDKIKISSMPQRVDFHRYQPNAGNGSSRSHSRSIPVLWSMNADVRLIARGLAAHSTNRIGFVLWS